MLVDLNKEEIKYLVNILTPQNAEIMNKKTGEVYKPASWKSPHTKYVRFDLRIISDREKLHDHRFTDWAGGYLYLRG